MTIKVLNVRTCFECPNYREDMFAFYCKGLNQQLTKEEVYTIPSWCPLPDQPDHVNDVHDVEEYYKEEVKSDQPEPITDYWLSKNFIYTEDERIDLVFLAKIINAHFGLEG